MNQGQLIGRQAIKDFVFGGNATFTVRSTRTGQRFTYQVQVPNDTTQAGGKKRRENSDVHFVRVLTGPDNTSNYTFVGSIFRKEEFRLSTKSVITVGAPSVKGFVWFLRLLLDDQLPEFIEVTHTGRCCRCGRLLTVPESVASGIGPECQQKVAGVA